LLFNKNKKKRIKLESELVAGFMTEHGASIFVFFFLGEYSSLILMSAFMSIFFLGGYHFPDVKNNFLDLSVYFYLFCIMPIKIGLYLLVYEVMAIINGFWVYIYSRYEAWVLNPIKTFIEVWIKGEDPFLNNKVIMPKSSSENTETIDISSIFADLMKQWCNDQTSCQLLLKKMRESINYKNESSLDNIFTNLNDKDTFIKSIGIFLDKVEGSFILGIKIIFVVFFFIWVRASFPRLRYDQLMSLCWKELLPLVFGYIILTIFIFYVFNMMPVGTSF